MQSIIEIRQMNLFDCSSHKETLKDLKLNMDRAERELKKAKREFEQIQKDYYIRFMIEGIERITKKRE